MDITFVDFLDHEGDAGLNRLDGIDKLTKPVT